MTERLVDVQEGEGGVLHVFPVALGDENATDAAFQDKALQAAGHCELVPEGRLSGLSTQMHISRSGPLEPDSDDLGVLTETKEGLDQIVRERAYQLWEEAGCPDGQADKFWHQAQHQRFCERAYALWEREGRPDGKADEIWYRVRAFEES